MAAQIAGKYQYVGDDGKFGDYLRATGLAEEHVEIGTQLKPTLEFTESGDNYTLKISSEVINKEYSFKIGQEQTEKSPSGKDIKATYTKSGNKLVQKQTLESGFQTTIDHEFTPEGLTLTYTWNNGKCVRRYKRV